jgi:hypothetical protein
LFQVGAFKHQHGGVSIRAKERFAEDPRLLQLPEVRRLGLEQGIKVGRRRSRSFDFQRENLHDQLLSIL